MNPLKLSNRKSFVTTVVAISLLITFPSSAWLIREAIAQTTHEVNITDFAFVPQNLTINCGDTVMWNNTDPVIHTLWFVYVANGSTYLLSDPIPPDTTWTHTFNDAVELQYYSFDKLWITGFTTVAIPGDANGDGTVDGSDFFILLQAWGTTPPSDPRADFNCDGTIDGSDFFILLQNWGRIDC